MMKISIARRTATLTLVGLSALLLAACSSVKLDDVDAANTGSGASASGSGSGTGKFSSQPWNDPNSPLFQRSVYFDLNEYTVQTKYQKQLSTHANFLKANPKQKIIIQGNTDERGTAEYNLALGQRRSDAVRRSLNQMGVSDEQVEAVSFGKEKPKAEGDNEAAWTENRRADIVYITN
jgi:peptidoglycan-associated lipoprotein